MKGLISHARVFGVYPESSQEPVMVYMLADEGTPLTLLWANGFKKAKDWKLKEPSVQNFKHYKSHKVLQSKSGL